MYRPILQKSFLLAGYDEHRQVVKATWRGVFSGETYRLASAELLVFANRFTVRALVLDLSEAFALKPMDQVWFNEQILPMLVQQGLRVAAVVTERSVFRIPVMASLLGASFDDEASAETWINEHLATEALLRAS